MIKKKLKLRWVTNVIGDDYKNWKPGDIVEINAQTGTGKTLFVTGNDKVGSEKVEGIIDRMNDWESLIYICNRVELKRQIKLDLLKNIGEDKPIKANGELDIKTLDELTKIGNVVITSYHAISSGVLDNEYFGFDNNLDNFDYIICDECHFFLTDSSFNNKTRVAFYELVRKRHRKAIKIFISATMDEVKGTIKKSVEDIQSTGFGSYSNCKLHQYSTGIDYSYLDIKYFSNSKDIINLIKNDKSNEKWVVFTKSKKDGENFKEELISYSITSEFIIAGSKTEEAKNITDNCKFECKVLIATKCLDNGVNIKDVDVKNIVVMAYDKTTFIQMIGRIRIDIENAPTIKLYISTWDGSSIHTMIYKQLEPKKEAIELFNESTAKFKRKYNDELPFIKSDLFYLDTENKWTINILGSARLHKDYHFLTELKEEHKKDRFAFVKIQLQWLGFNVKEEFNKSNLIEDIMCEVDIKMLKEFIENAYYTNDRYSKDTFIEMVTEIINMNDEIRILFNKISGNSTGKGKGFKPFNNLFEHLGINYQVGGKRYKINGVLETKWIITES